MAGQTEAICSDNTNEHDTASAIRKELEEQYGQVWDRQELQRDFEVNNFFMYEYANVIRKSDGIKGVLTFIHAPRFYFNFQPSK